MLCSRAEEEEKSHLAASKRTCESLSVTLAKLATTASPKMNNSSYDYVDYVKHRTLRLKSMNSSLETNRRPSRGTGQKLEQCTVKLIFKRHLTHVILTQCTLRHLWQISPQTPRQLCLRACVKQCSPSQRENEILYYINVAGQAGKWSSTTLM